MRKHVVIAFVAAALLALGLGAARAEPLKIRIGWVVCPPELTPVLLAPPGVARHLGKSYAFEPQHFQGTPAMITALAAGQLDIAPFTYPTFGTAIENAGISDLRVVFNEFEDGVPGYFTEPYLVLKSSGIGKVEDLKGKVLATNAVGSGVDIAMRAMLKKHGLEDKRDYSVVEIAFPNMKSVLLEGKVSLITATVLSANDPELKVKAKTLFTEKDAVGETQFALWTARESYIKAHRAALVDFMEDSLRALRWYLDPKNHDQAVKIVADFIKRPPQLFTGWLLTHQDQYRDPNGLPNVPALQRNLDTAQRLGFLKSRLEASKYLDLSLVKAAAARLK
ncbi:MAG: ABC transporter substrate-binding protein [Alphaproteobacteria bacterium]|nr:ABC transporter substrate-binding protein [Alphaproteobacteria bacterium]